MLDLPAYCPQCLVGSREEVCWLCAGPMTHGRVEQYCWVRRADPGMEAAITSFHPAEPMEYKTMDGLVWGKSLDLEFSA